MHRETHERRVSSGSRSVLRRLLRHENAVLVIILLVLVGVFGGLTKGVTLKLANVTNIMLQSSTRGVAALGQAFVMLTAGIDLSVGGIALMTSVIGATLLTERPVQSLLGYPIPIADVRPGRRTVQWSTSLTSSNPSPDSNPGRLANDQGRSISTMWWLYHTITAG